jgi:mannose-6-phosphate isomerase
VLVIAFKSLTMERVWGGRSLETFYGRSLPAESTPIGEAWELVDRKQEQSVVCEGPYDGTTLHDLWINHRDEIFGTGLPDSERFPLLVKILDAREDLSIQVHPPTALAASLGGEPKTEIWYIADALPGARIFAGLRKEADRATFEKAIAEGTVAEQVHEITVKTGDSIFIPSGRLHAIGAGLLIFEIQQNSDTTYRVFDWNRVGLDGQPRELHVKESLASIDFTDIEPVIDVVEGNLVASCQYFVVERFQLAMHAKIGNAMTDRFSILNIIEGELTDEEGRLWKKGDTLLLSRGGGHLTANAGCVVLRTHIP